MPGLPQLERERTLLLPAGSDSTLMAGDAATPRALADAGLRYKWLHFSGHALRLRETAVLVAAPDGSSGLEDERRGLWGLQPPRRLCSELVFFAACSTGWFHETETLAPSQLADAAIAAGARTAVAALWDVDSEATTELASGFYATLRRGQDAKSSLYEAARLLRENPKYRHPYYWAAFVVFEA